jgi:hypothetical protein
VCVCVCCERVSIVPPMRLVFQFDGMSVAGLCTHCCITIAIMYVNGFLCSLVKSGSWDRRRSSVMAESHTGMSS